jgi:hypothetical protein
MQIFQMLTYFIIYLKIVFVNITSILSEVYKAAQLTVAGRYKFSQILIFT